MSQQLHAGVVIILVLRFLVALRADPFTWTFQVMSAIATLLVPLYIFINSQFVRATPKYDQVMFTANKVNLALTDWQCCERLRHARHASQIVLESKESWHGSSSKSMLLYKIQSR